MTLEEKKEPQNTCHRVHFGDAGRIADVDGESVALVVTSPPYPMIAMWDEMFAQRFPKIRSALKAEDGPRAFDLMHRSLLPVWQHVHWVLAPGGFVCINIGDAGRTVKGNFQLYTNHVRILTDLQALGLNPLPAILWRKQTNAPNKFMGSGMLPAGAYVTLEHEYVLILRKGGKRQFLNPEEKQNRHESAIFWEERNQWFSDIWMDLKGTRQALGDKAARKRSAAFPFELAYRLVLMYSVRGDTVFDPFLGTGTTMAAAMAAGRNSIGVEIDNTLGPAIEASLANIVGHANRRMAERLDAHREFVRKRIEDRKPPKHSHSRYGFPVITRQETQLRLQSMAQTRKKEDGVFEAVYGPEPEPDGGSESGPDASPAENPPPDRLPGQLKFEFQ